VPGCYVSRRDLLRWTAFVAAASTAGLLLPPRRAGAAGEVTPTNLELVTLTEDRAVITWWTGATGSTDELGRLEPTPADAVVEWGTDPANLDRATSSERTDTPYHRVELTGLEPGRTYHYRARSAGLLATPTPFSLIDGNAVSTEPGSATGEGPFSFTVPEPPPGDFLFAVVLCNDMHVGETVAGKVGDLPALAGVSQAPGLPPYPEVMFGSLVDDAAALGARYLLAAGDITAEAEPADLATARAFFDRFGEQRTDWWAARGNHDRAHEGEAWATCRVGRWQGHDCFVDEFFPDGSPTYSAEDLQGLRVIGLDTYDTPGDGGDAGALGDEQLEWFRTTLGEDPDRPTLVFGHHPLVVEDSPYPSTPGSALDVDQAAAIRSLYGATPGVFLHHAGHTHRNKRSELAGAPGVVHQEVAAVKEYPGGFTLLRVHTGGYALNFHKSSSDDARAWSERSRTQVGGSWPQFSLGSRVSDRNAVVARDLSDLRAAPARSTQPAPADGEGSGNDGGLPGEVLAGAGITLVAAGAGGLLAWRRRATPSGP
jgi:hypothetical protein